MQLELWYNEYARKWKAATVRENQNWITMGIGSHALSYKTWSPMNDANGLVYTREVAERE